MVVQRETERERERYEHFDFAKEGNKQERAGL